MSVAHTMMMEGDLKAMDRVIKLAGELDRYHGFSRGEIASPPQAAPPPQISPPARELLLAKPATVDDEAEISPPQSPETPRNGAGNAGGGQWAWLRPASCRLGERDDTLRPPPTRGLVSRLSTRTARRGR